MNAPTVLHRLPRPLLSAALLVFSLGAASAVHAQTWNETGDAGDLVASAQLTVGISPLTTLTGSLAAATDVDVYCIRLTALPPAGLPIVSLACVVNNGPDVWLFDATGKGVLTNNSCLAGNKTIVAPSVSLLPGTYYVAVSYFGRDPQAIGGAIWLPGLPGQRAPDGPAAAGTLNGWAGTPSVQPLNPYTITFNVMGYCDAAVPAKAHSWGAVKSFYRT